MTVGVITYTIPPRTKGSRAKLDYIWWANADNNPQVGRELILSMVRHSPISNWSAILPETVDHYLLAFKSAGWTATGVVPNHYGRVDGIKFIYQEVRNVGDESLLTGQPIGSEDDSGETKRHPEGGINLADPPGSDGVS
jgi:hypothetical protein